MRVIVAVVAALLLAACLVSAELPPLKPAVFAAGHLRTPSNLHVDPVAPSKKADPTSKQVALVPASINDIVHQTQLGAQFLKTAAQLATMLSAEDKAKMKDDAMMEATHDIVAYAKTLMASMGPHGSAATPPSSPAFSSESFWTLRGSRPKPRPTCTVTSGYWDRKCECEFIPKHHRPHHRPRPDDSDEDDSDEDDSDEDDYHHHHHHTTTTTPAPPTTTKKPRRPKPSRPHRPSYPWYYPRPEYARPPEYYYPRPEYPVEYRPEYPHRPQEYWPRPKPEEHESSEEDNDDDDDDDDYEPPRPKPHHHHHHRPIDIDEVAERVEHLTENLLGIIGKLTGQIQNVHHHPSANLAVLRTEQREQLIKAPLAQLEKLSALLKNQKLVKNVKTSGGQEMERFLKQKVADVEAMVTYPDYMVDQLGKVGAKQPLVGQVQSIIDKLKPLSV